MPVEGSGTLNDENYSKCLKIYNTFEYSKYPIKVIFLNNDYKHTYEYKGVCVGTVISAFRVLNGDRSIVIIQQTPSYSGNALQMLWINLGTKTYSRKAI